MKHGKYLSGINLCNVGYMIEIMIIMYKINNMVHDNLDKYFKTH